MSVSPHDLSIGEIEKLLAAKRRQQRFSARLMAQRRARVNLGRVGNRALLLLEFIALLGLAVVVIAVLLQLQALNRETAQAQARSQSTDTQVAVTVAQAILPASSQPPASVMPERFKGLVRQVVPIALPTPGPQAASRIVIPAIKVDAPVVEGDDWEALKKGAGHHAGTANPGERGNLVISGHNDVFGEIFRYLENLKLGDEVTVYTRDSKFTYVVKGRRVVEPTEVSVMASTTEPTLTLITCYPYLVDTQRMIVFAQLAR